MRWEPPYFHILTAILITGEKCIMNYSVSQVNFFIKQIMAREEILYNISIEGEISNFIWHKTGHMFFTLKDEDSILRCIIFNADAQNIEFFPKDGMRVCVRGDIRVYEKDGRYSLYGHKMKIGGEGDNKKQIEDLEKQLRNEGIFELNKKISLPTYPENIGVITGDSSAALKDIVNIIERRYPIATIKLFTSLVQGEDASKELCQAIKRASKSGIDVLIIGRGGGQAEDLSAFNDEKVVRAVADCKVPVISAVGHEKDNSLVDLTACLRASTPSAAAELCVPDKDDLKKTLELTKKILYNNVTKNLTSKHQEYFFLAQKLKTSSVFYKLSQNNISLNNYNAILKRLIDDKLKREFFNIKSKSEALEVLNPFNVLKRGYAVVFKGDGEILKRKQDANRGDTVQIKLKDGNLKASIIEIER